MNIFNLFKASHSEEQLDVDYGQSLILEFDLTGEFGLKDEHQLALDLEGSIIHAIKPILRSDVDGHEFGDGEFRIYIYGSDVQLIFDLIYPILEKFPLKPIRYIIRFGSVEDDNAKEIHDRIL